MASIATPAAWEPWLVNNRAESSVLHASENRIAIDGSRCAALDLEGVPNASTIEVIGLGNRDPFSVNGGSARSVELQLSDCRAGQVRLLGRMRLRRLQIASAGPNSGMASDLESGPQFAIDTLCLHAGHFRMAHLAGVNHLELWDAVFDVGQHRTPTFGSLTLGGTVSVRGSGASTPKTTVFTPRLSLTAEGGVSLGRVTTSTSASTISIAGDPSSPITIASVPASTTLELVPEAAVSIIETKRRGASEAGGIEHLRVLGGGRLRIQSSLIAPIFDKCDALSLEVEGPSRVERATGHVGELAVKRAYVSGSHEAPLSFAHIEDATGAELEQLSLFRLNSVGGLAVLRDSVRLVPWVPSGPKARRLQAAQQLAPAASMNWLQNAHFWNEVSRLTRASGGLGGGLAADLGVLCARARRRSLQGRANWRERLALTAYALVGYGERILLPLITWTALVGIMTLLHIRTIDSSLPPWRVASEMFAAPLATFRVEIHRTAEPGIWDSVYFAIVQIAGIVLLGFSILALRRLVRPGERAG